ncbi:serine/threonine-protein kinase [Metabacillus fastidiosus]|uniref:serine/threonine-protein kinase n=1 Tax=Metabacillus fastidiosus TaxID=1458 RepID=UPI003D2B7BAC
MQAPNLSVEDVKDILHGCKEIITDLEYQDKGGQKTVYKCKINGELFALKFCDITDSNNNEANKDHENNDSEQSENSVLSRAKREIDIMDKVDTPTLVKLGPIGLQIVDYKDKTLLYFSEEFIEGKDLHNIIQETPLSIEDSIELAINITTAIDNLWSISMVHRDIKPKNIMRRENGQFVLLDTGIAFDIQGETLTAAFSLIGSPIYMSPEQLSGLRRELDFRSDLFLLGIVLYEAVTGTHPFFQSGLNTYQIVANITNNKLVPISTHVQDIPKKFERIIMRLLAKEPHLRYKSCEQLLKQLYSLKEELL